MSNSDKTVVGGMWFLKYAEVIQTTRSQLPKDTFKLRYRVVVMRKGYIASAIRCSQMSERGCDLEHQLCNALMQSCRVLAYCGIEFSETEALVFNSCSEVTNPKRAEFQHPDRCEV